MQTLLQRKWWPLQTARAVVSSSESPMQEKFQAFLGQMSGKTSGKTSGKILVALKQDGDLTIPELALLTGVTERSIERNIKKLQKQGHLYRVGPAKGGHWEVP